MLVMPRVPRGLTAIIENSFPVRTDATKVHVDAHDKK